MPATDAAVPASAKLTKVHKALLRKLVESTPERWHDDQRLSVRKTVEHLVSIGLAEYDTASPSYRLTAAGRDLADKLGEPKFVQRQRRTIDRVATYWTELFEIEELRPAFHLALTRILSRELRLTPDAPMPVCVCSMELPHNQFPHHCPAAVPRTIAVVDHRPDDLLLETINRIGLACDGGPTAYLPEFATMRIGTWVGPQDTIVAICRDPQDGDHYVALGAVREKAPIEPVPTEPIEPAPPSRSKEFNEWVEHVAFVAQVPR